MMIKKKEAKKKVKIREDMEFVFGHWKIKGEYYKETTANGKLILKHIDSKKIKRKITIAGKIAKKLEGKLDGYKVLMESIAKLKDRDMEHLFDMLFNSKKNYNIITREHHCVDMKVGNFILPIVDS